MKSLYWNDDKEIVDTFVLKTIKRFDPANKSNQELLPEYKDEEDREFARKLLADAMRQVSKDGVITIEESKSRDTNIGVVEGMQFDRGYLSPYFMTDADKMECVMENPYILIYDKKISNLKDFLPILQPAHTVHIPTM